MTAIQERVRQYYRTVDAGDPDATSALFAPTARYDRPGYETLVGPRIREFYRSVRVIESGAHQLTTIIAEGNRAAVCGVFDGRLKDGTTVRERFADFLVFDRDGLITERTTYFYRAAV